MKTLAFALCILAGPATAQTAIDTIRPDAPELAPYGPEAVGVRTVTLTDPDRIDVLAATEGATSDEAPRTDRTLTVELWYPAEPGTVPGTSYTALLRDGVTEVTLTGRAARDAAPAEGDYPLIVISHGYPGNRFLMSHLGENLASKGYVTASVDHPDSTYDDMGPFPSTLVNRPVDQAFVVEALTAPDGPLAGTVDPLRVGVIGYSMGGYGALIFAGAGLSRSAVERREPAHLNAPGDLLARHLAGSEAHSDLQDPRLRAVVAIGPWGRNRDFWDADGLAGIEVPLMIVAGEVDDVSGYGSMRSIFEETTGTERLLLTFENANHNAAAPIPAPAAAWEVSDNLGRATFDHYADAVWDNVRMNNVLAHFVTAFMDLHLKEQESRAAYLDLVPVAADGIWDVADDGMEGPDHTYWTGFPNRTAAGLRLERLTAGE
ncbi:alpha/beta hydrolase family protein [Jannaschia aquimarina]|uniref:Alpha/beta hydrolase family protein n=1 Tax=Jannaschia aquimarina TaxID=935700 RepID=A0A0D1EJI0_9RHOB|nr:dienelactone hydrolase [Jannaschia aquimarina]KIT17141.1 Alpha/beta hydrolase family protein [Jannaschia aquimarina]SNT29969.1 Predicted dienelactone hydrolase [Jannaschia aquimarina]